ncbi:MAG: AraC family transcriptional regulator [bacterium]|nr:AraC family transcriptional regulator [bacterium]
MLAGKVEPMPNLDIISFIFLLGAIQGLFLAALLLSRKLNTVANRVLAMALFLLSLELLSDVYYAVGLHRQIPHLIGVAMYFPYLYGPLFYLYAKLTAAADSRFKWSYTLHFIPFFFCILYTLPIYLLSGAHKLAFLARMETEMRLDIFVLDQLKVVHGLIYATLTFLLLKQHNKNVKNHFSNISRISLSWLKNLLIIITMVWSTVLVIYILALFGLQLPEGIGNYISIAQTLAIYAIGYLGLRQPEIFGKDTNVTAADFQPLPPEPPPINAPVTTTTIRGTNTESITEPKTEAKTEATRTIKIEKNTPYKKSGLNREKADQHFKTLLDIMTTQKPFIDPDLSLKDIANQLRISSHNLSEIINTRAKKNFYDFVNGYRVQEVMEKLKDKSSKNLTILAIGLDAGFNSKSSFNTIFKKQTHMTPSQFKKSVS